MAPHSGALGVSKGTITVAEALRTARLSAILDAVVSASVVVSLVGVHPFLASTVSIPSEAVIAGDRLKHVQPHRPFFRFEVAWLKLDTVEASDGATGGCDFRAQTHAIRMRTSCLTPVHACPLHNVVTLS